MDREKWEKKSVFGGLVGASEEQKVLYQTRGELRLLGRADSDYSLSTLPRGLTIGNSRVFHVEYSVAKARHYVRPEILIQKLLLQLSELSLLEYSQMIDMASRRDVYPSHILESILECSVRLCH